MVAGAERLRVASMRPRVFPAEDHLKARLTRRRGLASMRPRVFPAEDKVSAEVLTESATASMRPRVFPAEDILTDPPYGQQFHGLQ